MRLCFETLNFYAKTNNLLQQVSAFDSGYLLFCFTAAEKYQVLKSFRKISFEDFILVSSLGNTAFMGTGLVFYDREWYEKIAALLDSGGQEVRDAFQRTGLTAIYLFENDPSKCIPSRSEF